MAGFWQPNADVADAQGGLCSFADETIGSHYGISFSDGNSFVVVRKPSGDFHCRS